MLIIWFSWIKSILSIPKLKSEWRERGKLRQDHKSWFSWYEISNPNILIFLYFVQFFGGPLTFKEAKVEFRALIGIAPKSVRLNSPTQKTAPYSGTSFDFPNWVNQKRVTFFFFLKRRIHVFFILETEKVFPWIRRTSELNIPEIHIPTLSSFI